MLTIREVFGPEHEFHLLRLQKDTFPADPKIACIEGYWWIAYDDGKPVGFSCLADVPSWESTGYLSRVGVLPSHRGQGLARRLMRVCEQKAKKLGWARMISTTYCNPPSANNFIALRYRTYEPQSRWGAPDTIYWVKSL
jgi:GNAT superfamily N-acetyltransferase